MSRKQIEVGTSNLIPVTERSKEEAKIISAKGGRGNLNNPKSRRGAKLREIKKRVQRGQLTTDDPVWLLQRIESKELMDLDMLDWLNKLRKENIDPDTDAKLLSLYNQIAKTIHPPTQKVDVKVATLNLNEPVPDQYLEHIMEDFK